MYVQEDHTGCLLERWRDGPRPRARPRPPGRYLPRDGNQIHVVRRPAGGIGLDTTGTRKKGGW